MSETKSIGFLLFSGPTSQDSKTVAALAESAIKRGLEVHIFMMYEGVMNSTDEKLLELADQGVNITLCGHDTEELHAVKTDKFCYGSQYDHASMVGRVDKYISFI